jgi:hypothetical protein
MFGNSGLSLDQAPPIEVVLRLFLTGAIFGVVLSVMLMFWHQNLANIVAPTTLAIVHTFTLGIMASFMLGALFQMMPVLCGVHIKAPVDLAIRVNFTLLFGLIFLILAFINGQSVLYIFASILLGFALLASSYIMINRLTKIEHSNSSRGMLLAVVSLGVTAVVAILLLIMRMGYDLPFDYLALKSMHYSFGLYGWISLLIIAVSLQVIEMFYVTPKYSQKYGKYVTYAIFGLLLLYVLALFLMPNIAKFLPLIVALIVAFHSIITLIKLKRKKRPVNDASIYFWVAGMLFLALFALSYILNLSTILSAELFAFFALSIVFAMSYKITPFLVWFHLNAKGYFDAPMMHEVISPKYAKINFWLYLASVFALIASLKFTLLFYIASFLLLLSFLMLSLSIYNAWQKYDYTIEFGKKINLSI